jgi:hypothetical protein
MNLPNLQFKLGPVSVDLKQLGYLVLGRSQIVSF